MHPYLLPNPLMLKEGSALYFGTGHYGFQERRRGRSLSIPLSRVNLSQWKFYPIKTSSQNSDDCPLLVPARKIPVHG